MYIHSRAGESCYVFLRVCFWSTTSGTQLLEKKCKCFCQPPLVQHVVQVIIIVIVIVIIIVIVIWWSAFIPSRN